MSERFTLANRDNLNIFLGVLMVMGAMCPKCGHGTRVTSKRWARCKKPLLELMVEFRKREAETKED